MPNARCSHENIVESYSSVCGEGHLIEGAATPFHECPRRHNCGCLNGFKRKWRRRPDSNRSTGLCRPLPNHSATPPESFSLLGLAGAFAHDEVHHVTNTHEYRQFQQYAK